MPDDDFTPALIEFHHLRLTKRGAESQMQYALEQIRDQAATKPNGGAWAAGVALLCLATLTRS